MSRSFKVDHDDENCFTKLASVLHNHTMQSVRFTSMECNHLLAIAINALESHCMLQPFHLDTAYYSVNPRQCLLLTYEMLHLLPP